MTLPKPISELACPICGEVVCQCGDKAAAAERIAALKDPDTRRADREVQPMWKAGAR